MLGQYSFNILQSNIRLNSTTHDIFCDYNLALSNLFKTLLMTLSEQVCVYRVSRPGISASGVTV